MKSRSLLSITGFVVALLSAIFVLMQLRPGLIVANTTPAGGDMGAHVWGPAFLRDNLLSNGQLSGWTPDWYAGFPAFQFYMVVPALAIIAINAGFTPWLSIPFALGALVLAFMAAGERPRLRAVILTIGVLVAVLVVPIPYGIAFKLVAVAGLVFFPIAAWAMGRLSGAAEPVSAFLALGAMVFLFDTNFTIYGGNIASTLAGEFAFSISLCLSLLVVGWAMRGMDEGRQRASAAVLIALVALCHIIPLFFAMLSLALLVMLGPNVNPSRMVGIGAVTAAIPLAFADRYEGFSTELLAVVAFVLLFVSFAAMQREVRERMRWLLVVGPASALLASFWLVPFYLRRDFFNDMGWERLDDVGPALLTTPMRVALPIAVVGAFLSFATRERLGMLFSIHAVTFASAVANLGESKLWNARLLPFYYLSVYLLAGIGVALVARYAAVAASERFDRPDARVLWSTSLLGLIAALIAVGMPLRVLPFGSTDDEGAYTWMGLRTTERSFIGSWAAWNFSGYEEKNSYREYESVVEAMDGIGNSAGCGRAMWEYDRGLDRYGTPMALMLLPHWTDGCIGSMEGLYFESSATTPFHFLNQSALSLKPSSAQRDLPYIGFDMDRGVAQLRVMGVRYYMALTDEAIAAARTQPDLTELETAEPFVVFEVAGSELVEGLEYEPVVADGPSDPGDGELANRFDEGWLSQAVAFYNDPRKYAAMPAVDGPAEWERITTLIEGEGDPIEPATVSNIEIDTDRITFDVDEVGKPVLVKVSYFPNWDVSGGDGPWRIGPNLMVVVPTSTAVELSYGRTAVDWLGILLTLAGAGALVVMARPSGRRPDDSESDAGPPDGDEPDDIQPGDAEPEDGGPDLEPGDAERDLGENVSDNVGEMLESAAEEPMASMSPQEEIVEP